MVLVVLVVVMAVVVVNSQSCCAGGAGHDVGQEHPLILRLQRTRCSPVLHSMCNPQGNPFVQVYGGVWVSPVCVPHSQNLG